MPKLTRRQSLVLAGAATAGGVLALSGSGSATPAAAPAAPAPDPARKWRTISSRDAIRERYFPNYKLVTHEGKQVLLYDDLVKDKVMLLNFMFSSCDRICPRVTQNLVGVQRLLGQRVGRDVFMYSFTLDPVHDTPEALAEYAKMHRVGPGWSFITGAPAILEDLRRRLGFTDPDPKRDADRENHIGNVRYGNETRELWGACPGMSTPQYIVESLGWVEKPAPRSAPRARPV